MRNLLQHFNSVLNSRRFFWAVLVFFILESAWIALSSVYPMAFDENFHYGLIKTYAHYWLPFLSSQPPGADAYGAVPRDPSYLYHFTMSLPYRLIALVTHSEIKQVIILRFINIGLFGIGVVLFWQLLIRVRISPKLANLTLALFVLLPVVPLLAGQINYDNTLFPLVAWACLLTVDLIDQIQANEISVHTLLSLTTLCFFATLVKYEFLPIFAGIVLFLLFVYHRSSRTTWRKLFPTLWSSWQKQPMHTRLILALLLIISLGLFVQRDGFNLLKYHTFAPDCGQVLTVDHCSRYSPWNYNYYNHQIIQANKGHVIYENIASYTGWWAYWLWYRSYFAVNGPRTDFTNYPPLPLPAAAGAFIFIVGIIAIALCWRSIVRKSPYMLFFLVVAILYLIALWAEAYSTYRSTGVFEIMNGRYILPILLLVAALIGYSSSVLLRKLPVLKAVLAVFALVFFLEGGGFLTFIARSDQNWYWNNSNVIHANNTAKKVIRPVIIEGPKTYFTNVWMFN